MLSAASGRVIYSDFDDPHARECAKNKANFGRQVIIEFGDGLALRYAHLDDVFLRLSQTVAVDQLVGTVGDTGLCENNSGQTAHLHTSVYSNIDRSVAGCTAKRGFDNMRDYLITGSAPGSSTRCEAYAARFEFQQGAQLAVSGGTWNDRQIGLIGTSFAFSSVVDGVAVPHLDVSGPAGWNAGSAFRFLSFTPPGMSVDRSMGWQLIPPVSGEYTGTISQGGSTYRAEFEINATSQLEPPEVTRLRVTGGSVSISWKPGADAESFLVRINAVPFIGSVVVERVVPAQDRSASFNIALEPGDYQAVVWAFPEDLTTPGSFQSSFDIASDFRLFTVP